jgi:predicted amidohydrolase
MSEPRTITVAAIQPRLRVGEVTANLKRASDLVRQAHREHDPDVILLPEALTSPPVFGRVMRDVPQAVDGTAYQLITGLARELGCAVGAGFVARRGGDTRGTYVFAEPGGAVHLHDKDQPSLWENALFTAGTDDGLFTTDAFGTIGTAMGFEWGRSRTALRLRGRVQAVLGGSCWWSYPDWPPVRGWFSRDHQYNVAFAHGMGAWMARAVGAPVAIAQHVGELRSGSPLMPLVPYPTLMVGETQIVERDGRVLARMSYEDGEGYVAAPIELHAPAPLDPVPSAFWLAPMPVSLHAVWHLYNAHGRARYAIDKARGAFPWQALPDTDLPAYVPTPAVPDVSPDPVGASA